MSENNLERFARCDNNSLRGLDPNMLRSVMIEFTGLSATLRKCHVDLLIRRGLNPRYSDLLATYVENVRRHRGSIRKFVSHDKIAKFTGKNLSRTEIVDTIRKILHAGYNPLKRRGSTLFASRGETSLEVMISEKIFPSKIVVDAYIYSDNRMNRELRREILKTIARKRPEVFKELVRRSSECLFRNKSTDVIDLAIMSGNADILEFVLSKPDYAKKIIDFKPRYERFVYRNSSSPGSRNFSRISSRRNMFSAHLEGPAQFRVAHAFFQLRILRVMPRMPPADILARSAGYIVERPPGSRSPGKSKKRRRTSSVTSTPQKSKRTKRARSSSRSSSMNRSISSYSSS